MAILLDDTISGKASNSYASVAFADDYFLEHYDTTKASQWDALGDGQKQQLLVAACRVLETARFTNPVAPLQYSTFYDSRTGRVLILDDRLEPVKYLSYQALQFPRNLDVDPDTGDTLIPEAIQMAQCEQAIYILNFDETARAAQLQGVRQETLTIGRGQVHTHSQYAGEGSAFAPLALEYARPYLITGSGAKLRRA